MNDSSLVSARTFLFVPADRPERFDKAAAAGADAVVLDLEDAVAPANKAVAAVNAAAWIGKGNAAVVRINDESDLAAFTGLDCAIMLPKATATSTAVVAAAGHPVIALVETAQGVQDAAAIARVAGVVRLALGALDLAADFGVDPDTSPLIDSARAGLAYASAAAGIGAPVDGVTPAIDDVAAIERDLRRAQSFGMTGKLCIHPRQVDVVHGLMAPSASEVEWASRVLAALAESGTAVFSLDGKMVDRPVLERARRIAEFAQ